MKSFTVNSKDLFDKKKNPNLQLSVESILKNEQIEKHGFDERRTKIEAEECVTEQKSEKSEQQEGGVGNTIKPNKEQEKNKVTQATKYKIVFDNGKPFEVLADTNTLKKEIQDFYSQNKDSDYGYDFKVYNEQDEDISESQFIQEIVSEIIGEE